MLTFKAAITSEMTLPKDATPDITGNFPLVKGSVILFVSLRKEKFKFTKTRILFSSKQEMTFQDNLRLDYFTYECKLADNTHYKLSTTIKDDKTVYQAVVDCNNNVYVLTLHLNSINVLKLKLVHDLLKVPAWLSTILNKLFDKGLDALFAIIIAFTSYKAGEYNGKQTTKENISITSQQQDTTSSPKTVVDVDTSNAYNIDTSHSVPYSKDTTKTK